MRRWSRWLAKILLPPIIQQSKDKGRRCRITNILIAYVATCQFLLNERPCCLWSRGGGRYAGVREFRSVRVVNARDRSFNGSLCSPWGFRSHFVCISLRDPLQPSLCRSPLPRRYSSRRCRGWQGSSRVCRLSTLKGLCIFVCNGVMPRAL